MASYNPRNRNIQNDSVPLSWSQRYYDREKPRPPCGFQQPKRDKE